MNKDKKQPEMCNELHNVAKVPKISFRCQSFEENNILYTPHYYFLNWFVFILLVYFLEEMKKWSQCVIQFSFLLWVVSPWHIKLWQFY